jgi:hypothetical protein
LRHVVADTRSHRRALFTSAIPLDHSGVVPVAEALLGLAERLEAGEPANAVGVARVRVLLTDGTGPLYNRGSDRSMAEAVWWVADGLQLCPPHAWGCPKVMKLDPGVVAWTCGRCGAIETSGDLTVKPA